MASKALNAEPARPADRKAKHLPPKSYKQALEQESGHSINGINGDKAQSQDGPSQNGDGYAAVLGTSHADGRMENMRQTEHTGVDMHTSSGKSGLGRQDSDNEYTAHGLDDSPKNSHRKRRSHQKSVDLKTPNKQSGSISREDTQPKETKKNNKLKSQLIFENFEDEKSKEKLVSVGPRPSNGKSPSLKDIENDPERRLISGREAGKGWGRSKIRFAPWNVPLQRRLQTLALLIHALSIASCLALFFCLCAIPILWPLIIAYMIYISISTASTDGKLSHRSEALRTSSAWSLFASYFPARLHRMEALSPTRKYIFGYHPHGIISQGAYVAFCTEALGFRELFPGITNTLLTLDTNFRIPIYREYALALGLASVSKRSCENILSRGGPNGEGMGRGITIVVGGARESLDARPHTLRLVLRRRYGFIKLALRTGADLVPVLGFGENDLYDQIVLESHPYVHKVQMVMKKLLGWTIPLFHARGVFNYDMGLLPYRRPLNIVVGRPIPVAQNLKPSQEEIEVLHERYVQELERIWDTWKEDFAPDRAEDMEIVE